MSAATAHQVVCGCSLVVLLAAVLGGWLVRGSTAVPAACWAAAAAALAGWNALCQAAGDVQPASAAVGRVAVAALMVCPIMSLLGAKRPQHGVWQLIVATLAIVLALPAASAVLIRPGSFPDLHIIVRFFLPLLVLVGWMNFIGTRRAVAASLVAVGEFGLIWPLLPGVSLSRAIPQPQIDAAAAAAIAAGSLVAVSQSLWAGRRHALSDHGETAAASPAAARQQQFVRQIDGCLLPLRETLGAAWTLRLAERFATLAQQRGWPARLTFRGVQVAGDPADNSWQRDAARAAEAVLRRFVSRDWLRRHGWQRPEFGPGPTRPDSGRRENVSPPKQPPPETASGHAR